MTGTTTRALRLLSLLQARRVWSGTELMRRLGVSERTLRRDIERLRELGYEVISTSGPAGGYQLQAGSDMPPLLLDDDEAMAIAVSLLTAAGGTVDGMEETSVRALTKLEQVLPARVRRRVSTLQTAVEPLVRSWVTVDAETLTTVAQACRDQERLRFHYRNREGEETERNVEPHQLVSLYQRWYLLAYDRDRDDWRTFRVDRMGAPWATRMRFEPRPIPGGSAADYVEESRRSIPMRYQVVATVNASPDLATERLHHSRVELEAIGDERCVVRMQGDSLEWIAFSFIWLGVEFEIQEPPELVDYVAELTERLARSIPA